MKTFILAAALLCAAVTNKTFATDVNVTPAVMQTFKSAFRNAANVQWSVVDHLYKAVFEEDGDAISAFFNADGSLVASCRYLTMPDLSRAMQRTLKASAGSYAITEIFEVQNDTDTDYYATVKKGSEVRILKAADNKWNVYKK